MARRPNVTHGQYYRTRSWVDDLSCQAFDAPPPDGKYITCLAQGITVGPVQIWVAAPDYVTICVRGYWITVWKAWDNSFSWTNLDLGVAFADLVPREEVQSWKERGWRDPVFLMKDARMYKTIGAIIPTDWTLADVGGPWILTNRDGVPTDDGSSATDEQQQGQALDPTPRPWVPRTPTRKVPWGEESPPRIEDSEEE